MQATQSGSFKPVKLPKPQTTVARCYSVIHIGTVPNIYQGKIDQQRPKVEKIQVTWELPLLLAVFNEEKGEQPFVVGQELTLSTGEQSNLYKLIKQWRGSPWTKKEQRGPWHS